MTDLTLARPIRRPRLRRLVLRLWQTLERQRQRRDLALLDERALRDLGLSRAQAREEAAKSFWK